MMNKAGIILIILVGLEGAVAFASDRACELSSAERLKRLAFAKEMINSTQKDIDLRSEILQSRRKRLQEIQSRYALSDSLVKTSAWLGIGAVGAVAGAEVLGMGSIQFTLEGWVPEAEMVGKEAAGLEARQALISTEKGIPSWIRALWKRIPEKIPALKFGPKGLAMYEGERLVSYAPEIAGLLLDHKTSTDEIAKAEARALDSIDNTDSLPKNAVAFLSDPRAVENLNSADAFEDPSLMNGIRGIEIIRARLSQKIGDRPWNWWRKKVEVRPLEFWRRKAGKQARIDVEADAAILALQTKRLEYWKTLFGFLRDQVVDCETDLAVCPAESVQKLFN